MRFVSTRGQADPVSFADAFAAGLAPDGGLYVPEELPQLPPELIADESLSYADVAFRFLSLFDTSHDPATLRDIVDRSYSTFDDTDNPAPLVALKDAIGKEAREARARECSFTNRNQSWKLSVLELFHGPTLAFKDFGLQLVGNLFEEQIARTNRPINVLGATSGDTGSAAIHGLANKQGANVFILYPEGRISPLQERQMTCTGADNIFPIAIGGSFDDAQRIVKELFGDLEFKAAQNLSAVNSINLARILAQSVYYIWAVRQLPEEDRDSFTFIVPTGNFGNVFAGWLANRMGLPGAGFSVATNQNDILYEFFTTGRYESGEVAPSLAPSMDIQVASNFERFLYYHYGEDSGRTVAQMEKFQRGEAVEIPEFDRRISDVETRHSTDAMGTNFTTTRTPDKGIKELTLIARQEWGYLPDPHTACGFMYLADLPGPGVILATAHPAKFPDTIVEIFDEFQDDLDEPAEEPTHLILEDLKKRDPIRHELPADADAVRKFIESYSATA